MRLRVTGRDIAAQWLTNLPFASLLMDWQQEQDEYRAFSEEMDRKQAQREARIAVGESEDDVYASAWSSPKAGGDLPGDSMGYLKLSFRLAEIISDLEQSDAPNEIIKSLNITFRDYRQSDDDGRATVKARLQGKLDEVADQFPKLLPKVADFQSQLDERERVAFDAESIDNPIDNHNDDDFPF